ncbi:type IV pilus twitching motility protein PilT [Helicobacter sp. MIT 99-5507]|uniref:type IV pilus twitching motility protein PilT n=1 Tax=Helicobacter sp. MIT 99-5507 TaxID=152489 RepID=UPI002162749E|nr:PilT/PilU family type 4a pilus ATPase [Helicobacter sp. MIT 99-5507]
MESNIRLNNQITTSTPKINTIDVLANAKPIRLNNTPQEQENIVDIIKKEGQIKQTPIQNNQPLQTNQSMQNSQAKPIIKKTIQENTIPNPSQTIIKKIDSIQIDSIRQKAPNQIEVPMTPQINSQIKQEIQQNTMPSSNQVESKKPINNIQNKDNLTRTPLPSSMADYDISQMTVDIDKLDFHMTKHIRGYLKKLVKVGGSDLHIKAGSPIRARINGDIVIFSEEIISKNDALTFAKELTRGRFGELVVNKEIDMTYIYDQNIRFRVNIFFQMEGVSFAFRTIPTTHKTTEELGLPDAIRKIVDMERGLVLVTGITGSGKSTTLAAIINEINQKKAKHIITIEDPIEFVHKDIKSMLNQRSVGMDTNSFAKALKAALREDPDIILVGEMRDIETIEMALHAAETGHLVLSTLHTLDAKETINRIISVFPTSDQARIRAMLASVLAAIVSQRLLKATSGGRVAAVELLFKTPRIELIISEGRDGEILEALAEGKEIYQTQTFDQHLFDLVINGIVDEEVAMEKATSPSDLKLRLQNVNFAGQSKDDTISIKQ